MKKRELEPLNVDGSLEEHRAFVQDAREYFDSIVKEGDPWDDTNEDAKPTTRRLIEIGIVLNSLDKIDCSSPEEVKNRIAEYYRLFHRAGARPTVAGLAQALGLNRTSLVNMVNYGNMAKGFTPETKEIVTQAYTFHNTFWEMAIQEQTTNPANMIFLGKNNFGYVDQQQHVIRPEVTQPTEYDKLKIEEKYLLKSEDGLKDDDSE